MKKNCMKTKIILKLIGAFIFFIVGATLGGLISDSFDEKIGIAIAFASLILPCLYIAIRLGNNQVFQNHLDPAGSIFIRFHEKFFPTTVDDLIKELEIDEKWRFMTNEIISLGEGSHNLREWVSHETECCFIELTINKRENNNIRDITLFRFPEFKISEVLTNKLQQLVDSKY